MIAHNINKSLEKNTVVASNKGLLQKCKKAKSKKSVAQSFKLKLFHVSKEMLMRKLCNGFHVGKNGILVGNFQKTVIFQVEKGVLKGAFF